MVGFWIKVSRSLVRSSWPPTWPTPPNFHPYFKLWRLPHRIRSFAVSLSNEKRKLKLRGWIHEYISTTRVIDLPNMDLFLNNHHLNFLGILSGKVSEARLTNHCADAWGVSFNNFWTFFKCYSSCYPILFVLRN